MKYLLATLFVFCICTASSSANSYYQYNNLKNKSKSSSSAFTNKIDTKLISLSDINKEIKTQVSTITTELNNFSQKLDSEINNSKTYHRDQLTSILDKSFSKMTECLNKLDKTLSVSETEEMKAFLDLKSVIQTEIQFITSNSEYHKLYQLKIKELDKLHKQIKTDLSDLLAKVKDLRKKVNMTNAISRADLVLYTFTGVKNELSKLIQRVNSLKTEIKKTFS